jgi:hypothetical protein
MSKDNVIEVDFGAANRPRDEDIAELIRRGIAPTLEQNAVRRGYSPERANEIAGIVGQAAQRMFSYTLQFNITDAPVDDPAKFARHVAGLVGQQVAEHCARELARVVNDIAYPIERE